MPDSRPGPRGPAGQVPSPPPPGSQVTSEERLAARLAQSTGQGFAVAAGVGPSSPVLLINQRLRELAGVPLRGIDLGRLVASLCGRGDSVASQLAALRRGVRRGLASRATLTPRDSALRVEAVLLRPREGHPLRLYLLVLPAGSGGDVAPTRESGAEPTAGSPDLIADVSPSGRLREVNRTAERLTGMHRRELIGIRAPRLVHPADRPRLRRALARLRIEGEVHGVELRIRRREGPPLLVSASLTMRQEASGAGAVVRLVARDITKQALLTRQLRLTDRLAATGRLAAGVAHEINNPLQAILTHMALVDAAIGPDFSQRESWESVREGVQRIRQIVSEMLDLHRGRAASPGPVAVNPVVEEALGLCRAQLRQRGVRVRLDCAADLPQVEGNERHLYQVVLNLLLNALGVLERGERLSVRTRSRHAGSEVEIEIRDSGPGIPAEIMPHIFDPFHATEDGRGTGLGLFVAYGLVREYGGRIEVDTARGRGTSFRVLLPVAA